MRHVAAYLLLSLGGNSDPTAADVSDLLSSVGIEPDKKCLKERDPNTDFTFPLTHLGFLGLFFVYSSRTQQYFVKSVLYFSYARVLGRLSVNTWPS
jgi:hypothetical protein